MSSPPSLCVCGTPAALRCARCKSTSYCSKDCQRSDWATHKLECSRVAPAAHFSAAGSGPGAAAWMAGLSAADRFEWLCNCYSMRCDDDYVWGACNLHGPYDPDATKASVTLDFLCFCLLAQRTGTVPADWPWAAFLPVASRFAQFAFEKSDAQERWGGENVFDAMMGGRSLRFTGEQVYQSQVVVAGNGPVHQTLLDSLLAAGSLEAVPAAVLDSVGGLAVWQAFQASVQKPDGVSAP